MHLGQGLQLLGLALLVVFAGTFGARWALLVGALVLIFLGLAFSDVPLPRPARHARPASADPASVEADAGYGIVSGVDY